MSPSRDRPLRLPPADLGTIKIPRTRQPARNWFRVHKSVDKAVYFSLDPVHRYSHSSCPFDFLYLGVDIDTCLFERFGDTAYNQKKSLAASLWRGQSLSVVQVPELAVCDLTSAKTLSALMVDLSALMHPEVSAPQAWGLAIQQHPAIFQAIKYKSRFNGKACLALFRRDGIETRLKETRLESLPGNAVAADWLEKHQVSLH